MALLKKIRSRKGASITFALLAFLVCAVVSSVVLAAATATAGRASDLAKMDQRYYAVTSAAQLFRDTLDGQEYTIVRTDTQPSYTYTTYVKTSGDSSDTLDDPIMTGDLLVTKNQSQSLTMELVRRDDDPSDDTVTTLLDLNNDGEADTAYGTDEITDAAKFGFLADAAITCVFGGPKAVAAAYGPSEFGASVVPTAEKEMTIAVDGHSELAVRVKYSMKQDGSITFTFASGTGDEEFKMELVLIASVRDNSGSPTTKTVENVMVRAIDPSDAGGRESVFTERIETVTTRTKTTVITWNVAEVRKVS